MPLLHKVVDFELADRVLLYIVLTDEDRLVLAQVAQDLLTSLHVILGQHTVRLK